MATKTKKVKDVPAVGEIVTNVKGLSKPSASKFVAVQITGTGQGMLQSKMDVATLSGISSANTRKKSAKKLTPREEAEAKVYRNADGDIIFPLLNLHAILVSAGKFQKNGQSKLTSGAATVIPSMVAVWTDAVIIPQDFEVDMSRAVNPNTGQSVCTVRPWWPKWSMSFVIEVKTDLITVTDVGTLVRDAGERLGIGSWRLEKRGQHGAFTTTAFIECDTFDEAYDHVKGWTYE